MIQPLRPVRPLGYSAFGPSKRPQLITAMGVISIAVASLSILMNLTFAGWGASLLVAATSAPAPPPPAPVAPPTGDSLLAGDPGMPAQQRRIVTKGLALARPLSQAQTDQIDALLAKKGREMFLMSGPRLTVRAVRMDVVASGSLPAVDGGRRGDFFVIGQGRIEAWDDRAVFFPYDGSAAVRVPDPADAPRQATAAATQAAANQAQRLAALRVPALMLLIQSLLSVLLAAVLLIAGILVFRGSPAVLRLHTLYSWIKPPLAILGGGALCWVIDRLVGGTTPPTLLLSLAVALTVAALVYPTVLWFVLRGEMVRDYYAPPPGYDE